jgi:hypothetical protein
MKPIGLTYKSDGELMIVHLCLCCGRISCNRIAGDDNAYTVSCLLEESNSLREDIRTRLVSHGITVLSQEDAQQVSVILFGK